MRAWVCLLGLYLDATAQARSVEPDLEWNVFGADDRLSITSTAMPWSTIGRVSTACTGTLVGKRLMLTAAHCVFDAKTQEVSKNFTYFYPNVINGTALVSSWMRRVWYGTKTPDSARAKDWALVELKEPLGEKYGWMAVRKTSPAVVFYAAG
jgi:protease YdgD